MGTLVFTTSPSIPMVTIRNGIVRPQQITAKEHRITSKHTYQAPADKDGKQPDVEHIETWSVTINTCDSRLTDLLARLVSGVLFTNNTGIQNAEENVLRELGKWNEPVEEKPVDITKDPVPAPSTPKGQGDGN